MTGQDLIDFIETCGVEDWELEVKVHGEVVPIVDAVRCEGFIRLYPEESDE